MHYFVSRLPPFPGKHGKRNIPAGPMYGPECKTTYPLRVLSIRAQRNRSGLLPAFKKPPGPTPVFAPAIHRARFLAPMGVVKLRDHLLKFAAAVTSGALSDPRVRTFPIPTWTLPVQLRLDHNSSSSSEREFAVVRHKYALMECCSR